MSPLRSLLARRVADSVHLIMAGGYDTRVVQHLILLALPIVLLLMLLLLLLLLLLLMLAASADSMPYAHYVASPRGPWLF